MQKESPGEKIARELCRVATLTRIIIMVEEVKKKTAGPNGPKSVIITWKKIIRIYSEGLSCWRRRRGWPTRWDECSFTSSRIWYPLPVGNSRWLCSDLFFRGLRLYAGIRDTVTMFDFGVLILKTWWLLGLCHSSMERLQKCCITEYTLEEFSCIFWVTCIIFNLNSQASALTSSGVFWSLWCFLLFLCRIIIDHWSTC